MYPGRTTKPLPAVYQASTEEAALMALDAFAGVWDDKHPQISKSWRAHQENLNTFFGYPPDICKAIPREPDGLQVCPCRPAAMRLSVRRLMRIYQAASLNCHWNASVLVTAASGNYCAVKVFMLITSACTTFII